MVLYNKSDSINDEYILLLFFLFVEVLIPVTVIKRSIFYLKKSCVPLIISGRFVQLANYNNNIN